MRQGIGNSEQGVAKQGVPIRGTQSFVGVMVEVWKRPSLTALEVLWRWCFGGLLFLVFWFAGGRDVLAKFDQWQASVQIALHGGFISGFQPAVFFKGLAWPAVALVAWAVVSAFGRDAVLRRFDGTLASRRGTVAVFAVLRVIVLAAFVIAWFLIVGKTAEVAVFVPLACHAYPAYVPGFAVVLMATLLLFVAWCLLSWIFQLAPLLAMVRDCGVRESVMAAIRAPRELRSKLIETNLVMGIVKVALLVLAMVFSACPLPFATVETQMFLNCWWFGVGVVWLLLSDYFHVVRAAAYLRLWRAYNFPAESTTP